MSANVAPRIVRDGLVLHLDTANSNSYVSGSSVWNDLTINSITGSLVNSPTYNSSNGGSIVLNGSSNYINFGNRNLGLDLVDKSFCAWVYLGSPLTNPSSIIDKDFDSGGNNYGGWGFWVQSNRKLWWWAMSNQDVFDSGASSIGINVWTHVAVTYNATTKTASFYINGSVNSVVSNANIIEKSSGNANLVIGATRNGVGGFLSGRVSNVVAYNRILTATEIRQNYNALKGRFGV